VGWRGTLRSLEAASRAAERENQRRRKIAFKAQVVASAAEAVTAWEQYVDSLIHVRTDAVQAIDWRKIASEPRPLEPKQLSEHHDDALEALKNFKPRFFDFLQGGSHLKQQNLQEAVNRAPELDAADFAAATALHAKILTEWEENTLFAARVLRREPTAFKQVIKETNIFSSEGLIGSSIKFSFGEEFVHAIPSVHAADIIPSMRPKQTPSGKLSETKVPVSQFNELYQDYVAGVALRIANDVLCILPIEELCVTCRTMMLNTQTGHQELMPVLSVQIVRATLARLNLARVDASDAIANFNHSMKFKKLTGFEQVAPLKPID
jgi:hypothetical protein